MPAQRKYPNELRERATRMAIDARKDPATRTGAFRRIGEQLGVNPEALRTWVSRPRLRRVCDRDDDGGGGHPTGSQFEREVRELHRASTILKQAKLFAFSRALTWLRFWSPIMDLRSIGRCDPGFQGDERNRLARLRETSSRKGCPFCAVMW